MRKRSSRDRRLDDRRTSCGQSWGHGRSGRHEFDVQFGSHRRTSAALGALSNAPSCQHQKWPRSLPTASNSGEWTLGLQPWRARLGSKAAMAPSTACSAPWPLLLPCQRRETVPAADHAPKARIRFAKGLASCPRARRAALRTASCWVAFQTSAAQSSCSSSGPQCAAAFPECRTRSHRPPAREAFARRCLHA